MTEKVLKKLFLKKPILSLNRGNKKENEDGIKSDTHFLNILYGAWLKELFIAAL